MPFSRQNTSAPKPLSDKYIQNPLTIGEKIRNRRLELSLLQKDVAPLLGTVEESIYRWETNKNEHEIKYMPKIIEFLGYFPFDIVTSTIGGQIKKYRYLHGLSQEQVANQLQVNESTVFNYENGKHKPTLNIIKKIESFLKEHGTGLLIKSPLD